MDNYVWFQADKQCTEQIMCTQYCGLYHAGMLSKVVAISPGDFEKWVNTKEASAEATPANTAEAKEIVETQDTTSIQLNHK